MFFDLIINFRIVSKVKAIIFALILIGVIVGAIFFSVGYFKPKGAGIFIETTPNASVLIDGEIVGRTPYRETRSPGDVVIKLVPESFDRPLAPYETKVNLVSGIETVVRREFAETDDKAGGEILTFEKTGGSEAGLAVVTIPDSIQISIDGTSKAFTPFKTSSIQPGKYILLFSSPGFVDKTLEVRIIKGYKLMIMAKLIPDETEEVNNNQEEEIEVQKEPEPTRVEILSTSTGFLRVRDEPSTLGVEVAQVKPGEKYILLEEDEKTGWFKIEYEEGKEGWISNQYAEILDDETQSSSTPSADLQ